MNRHSTRLPVAVASSALLTGALLAPGVSLQASGPVHGFGPGPCHITGAVDQTSLCANPNPVLATVVQPGPSTSRT